MKAHTLLLVAAALAATALAAPPMTQPTPPTQEPRLVLDAAPDRCDPKCFRTSDQLAKVYPGDTTGLSELRASGSASFSRAELAKMQGSFSGPTIVVDLRQESHALINGIPITWYAPSDWGNVGKTNQEIKILESEQLQRLPATLEMHPSKDDDEGTSGPVHLEVESRRSEQEIAEQLGLGYFRLYVSDHVRPTDSEVDRFLEFVDLLPPGLWLHFHCRGGKGRTTTFLTMYDILRNAREVAFQDIIQRQMALPPHYKLLDERSQSPRHVYYQERAEFIRQFYEFARQRRIGLSWSLWQQSH